MGSVCLAILLTYVSSIVFKFLLTPGDEILQSIMLSIKSNDPHRIKGEYNETFISTMLKWYFLAIVLLLGFVGFSAYFCMMYNSLFRESVSSWMVSILYSAIFIYGFDMTLFPFILGCIRNLAKNRVLIKADGWSCN